MSSLTCSFCGKSENEVEYLLSGTEGNICNKCIEQAYGIVTAEKQKQQILKQQIEQPLQEESSKKRKPSPTIKIKTPKEVKRFLDQYIIGQDKTKRIVSVAVYNHYKRIIDNEEDAMSIQKSNILIVGPTGTGKSLMATAVAKMLNVPIAIADATVLTEAGYVGEDVESLISKLLQASNYDVGLAEKGVIFIDELDKISRKSGNPSITRDVSGEGVQQGLLKLLEGSIVNVPPQGGRKHPDQKFVEVNTSNILFIAGGAFEGIESHIKNRLNAQALGFGAAMKSDTFYNTSPLNYITHNDLKAFGLIPEILGRFPIISHMDEISFEMLKDILTKPKNALIKQYRKLFKMDNIDLEFTEGAINLIAEEAIKLKLGARGLRSLCEAILSDAMFDLPGTDTKELKITKSYAEEKFRKNYGSINL